MTPKFFIFRLLSPRPTFPGDMTADEAAAMQRHGAFWAQHTEAGRVVVVGPVADPAGPWGLAVVRVADERAARELEAADPIIQSGLGFRYEILPMMRAIVGPPE